MAAFSGVSDGVQPTPAASIKAAQSVVADRNLLIFIMKFVGKDSEKPSKCTGMAFFCLQNGASEKSRKCSFIVFCMSA